MLHLIVRLDGEAYALEVGRIVEILPLVAASKPAHASSGVTSAVSYRGLIVPIVDLAALILGRPSQPRLSTRIVLVRGVDGGELVGLIAENATELLRIAPDEFSSGSLTRHRPDHLGPIAVGSRGPIQRIELDCLPAFRGEPVPTRAA